MRKKALLIGNAAYPESPLRNPVNDAVRLSAKLSELGFACKVGRETEVREMQDALKLFAGELNDSEVGLFFFAGHGMQIDGDNYLTAIDTDFDSETDAKYSSLPLNKVIEVLEKGNNATSIIILDACRNNPYERKWRGVGSRGLAPVYAPKGTIIAFATSPGQVALDGDKDNGAFTAALLKHLATQNVTVEDLFKRVRNTLSATTSGKQISWEHTSLMGDFFFNPAVLSADYLAAYSQEARADAAFEYPEGRPLNEIIQQLRSHNWYVQNPAITALSGLKFADSTKDELFVLGRNLYQAACGGSKTAISYFDSLAQNLKQYEKEATFHILNGMLYEIYFDSHDSFRIQKKTDKIDEVFLLEDAAAFRRSFDFIRQSLLPYQKQLFYVPGLGRDVLVDIELSPIIDDKSTVQGIAVEGQDVFYTGDGQTLVANAAPQYQYSRTIADFEQELLEQMVTPKRRLRLTYSQELNPKTSVLVPYDYKIQRISS